MPWVDLKRIMLSGDKPSPFPLYGTLERQNYKNRLMPARGEGSSERGKWLERAEWGILRLEMFCISTTVVTWICGDTITWKYIQTHRLVRSESGWQMGAWISRLCYDAVVILLTKLMKGVWHLAVLCLTFACQEYGHVWEDVQKTGD